VLTSGIHARIATLHRRGEDAMKAAVFGLGYAGTVSAACLAQGAHDVWGVDIDPSKVEAVASGTSPVVEPGLAALIATAVERGSLHATTDLRVALDGADVALVCVGTPASDHGRVDLSHVETTVEEIALAFASTATPAGGRRHIVIRSTVPPGTIDNVVRPIVARSAPSGTDYAVATCPEFLREGSGVRDFFDPPFTVIGTDDPAVGAKVAELFSGFDARIRVVETRTAEALKYACNAFHATKIVFANEIARLLQQMEVDARTVMELFCEDERLNLSSAYLRPGFAFGGSCLPKDLRALLYLARVNNVDLPMLAGTLPSNDITISSVVDRVIASGARNVALLGLSFKMNTDDLRESPHVTLAETLIGKGFNVRIYDPIVNPSRLIGANKTFVESKLPHLRQLLTDSVHDAVDGAEIVIVSSTDDEVVNALLVQSSAKELIDISGQFGAEIEALPAYSGVAW
jgi:GDP-mannose 6-dehydrogenase